MAREAPDPRKGMPSPQLDEFEFKRRFCAQFIDPAFNSIQPELAQVADAAWKAYKEYRKSPRTRKAGEEYADPDQDLAADWLDTRRRIEQAAASRADPTKPLRLLLVNSSSRSEHTCPGEASKSWRFVEIARDAISATGSFEVEVLDLARLASEYGRKIHPCKACFSTSPALCHWPCSCYPNYAMGQTQDWMNDIYPMWVAAHGVMIVTPVNWYQTSSPLKLMMDRLVCADGGNPDPTLTSGKDPARAKQVELAGWHYPKHLAGRLFSIIVHGDVEGAENVRRSLADWLSFMGMHSAGSHAELDRYVGYWKPYATSHQELDDDLNIQEEVRNAARTLAEAVVAQRDGRYVTPGSRLRSPRQK